MLSLSDEVAAFRKWADATPHGDSLWELDYQNWPDLLAASEASLLNDELTEEQVDLLLFVLARDNEAQQLQEALGNNPRSALILSRAAISRGEAEARWQIADYLGSQPGEEAREIQRLFLADADEYVRRRALLAMTEQDPRLAETTALIWLGAEHEYSRLAALSVLQQVQSSQLQGAIERLREDPSWVVRNKIHEMESAV